MTNTRKLKLKIIHWQFFFLYNFVVEQRAI